MLFLKNSIFYFKLSYWLNIISILQFESFKLIINY